MYIHLLFKTSSYFLSICQSSYWKSFMYTFMILQLLITNKLTAKEDYAKYIHWVIFF